MKNTIEQQSLLIDKLIENGFKADERLAQAQEVVKELTACCCQHMEMMKLSTTIYGENIKAMREEKSKLIDYILHGGHITINNKNEI